MCSQTEPNPACPVLSTISAWVSSFSLSTAFSSHGRHKATRHSQCSALVPSHRCTIQASATGDVPARSPLQTFLHSEKTTDSFMSPRGTVSAKLQTNPALWISQIRMQRLTWHGPGTSWGIKRARIKELNCYKKARHRGQASVAYASGGWGMLLSFFLNMGCDSAPCMGAIEPPSTSTSPSIPSPTAPLILRLMSCRTHTQLT